MAKVQAPKEQAVELTQAPENTESTTTVQLEVPQAEETPEDAEARLVAEAKAKIQEEKRKEQLAHIAKLEGELSKALAAEKTTKDFMEQNPDLGLDSAVLARKSEVVAICREDIKAYKLSIQTPEERELQIKHDEIKARLDAATAELAALREQHYAKYPQVFGGASPSAPKAAKAAGSTKSTVAAGTPFTGVMLENEVATERIKALVNGGMTSETEMIKALYGEGFTITGSKPRFQVHSIREKLGLLAVREA